MVARSEDKPRTITERVSRLDARADEVNRALGRGSEALRNADGSILTLEAASSGPVLVPQQTDTGLKFANGRLEVTDETGAQLRDLRVRRTIGGDVALLLDTSTAYITATDGNGFRAVQAGDVYAHGNVLVDGRVRGNVGSPGDGYTTYGTHQGSVSSGGAPSTIEGGVHTGNTASFTDSVGAVNLVYGGRVEDALGNVRNGASMPDVKTDLSEIDPAAALAALAKLRYYTFRYIGDFVASGPGGELRRFAGPMLPDIADDPLLATMVRREVRDDGREDAGFDIQSMVGMIAAALPAVRSNLDAQVAALGPLRRTADQLPDIVAHSNQVHTELQQGLDAIRTAVGAVQVAAQSLTTSLGPISQTAAQAYAASAVANTKITALESRVAALEARRVQTFRAAGNLPTLAVNATTPVSCPWTSSVPSPLPTVDQCQVFVAAGSAVPTVTAVGASGVTVSLKATAALLPTAGAVQVFATTLA